MYFPSALNVGFGASTSRRLKVVLQHINTMATKVQSKEMQIPLPCGGHISGKIWNENGKTPILGLHGWLDNAGTFDSIAPLLPSQYCLVAIDFPGHGRSSRRPPGTPGISTSLLPIIHRVVHHFNWDKVTLMGHSMGGGAAFLYACVMLDKVDKLILLDALKPIQVDPIKQPARTAKYLKDMFDCDKKLPSEAPSYEYDVIVDRMIKTYGGSITEESAKLLLKRGSIQHENGEYSFSYDPQLKLPNIFSMCHNQQKAFANLMKCEVLILKASLGPLFEDKFYYEEILKIIENGSSKFIFEVVEGTHHVHLNNPSSVTSFIEKFLAGELESSPYFDL